MALVPSLQAGSEFGKYCFSHDSKYLFCCCGSVIKVYNTTNGECVNDLRCHSKLVTGVAVNPSNVLQIISCGQDGMLIFWDFLDGARLKQYNLHMPLYGIVSIKAEKKSIIMITQTSELKNSYCVMQWDRKKSNPDEFSKPRMLIEECDGRQKLISFGCMKAFLASGLKNELAVYSMKKGTTCFIKDSDKFNKTKAITCVACHPTEYCIAVGIENGRILLWHNFFSGSPPLKSTLHWHALPVLCLDFTPDGSGLLSGGHECVLVRWQMSNHKQRDFKPRLGAPITDVLVSQDGTLYGTKHSNNVVQLLDMTFKIQQVYRGMSRTFMRNDGMENPIPCGLKYDQRSRTLVTNGLPGHLQFYSLQLNKQLFNLDIVGQNFISAENIDRPKVVTEILSLAISDDGLWLATFEMWDDHVFSPELRLKFWSYSTEAQTYCLNTTVECPHDKRVTSIVFRPASIDGLSPTAVTIGEDLCFKIWSLIDDSDIYRKNTRWSCESVGVYRGLRALCADFSLDGTTLAVGFEHLLTIWDPDNNVVRTTLSSPLPIREDIVNVKFGSHGCRHQLVVTTTGALVSWDLLTLTVQWSIDAKISVLVRDPSSDLMACVHSRSSVSIFRPSSGEMIFIFENMSKSKILDAVFVPGGRHRDIVDEGWPGDSQLYVYNEEQQLITLDLHAEQLYNASRVKIAQSLPPTAYSSIMAESLVRDQDAAQVKDTIGKTRTDDEFMSKLLLSNEPISLHCEKYLSGLLVTRKQKKKPKEASFSILDTTNNEDVSSSSESDDEMDTSEHDQVPVINTEASRPNLDALLQKPADWVEWCASLKLT